MQMVDAAQQLMPPPLLTCQWNEDWTGSSADIGECKCRRFFAFIKQLLKIKILRISFRDTLLRPPNFACTV